jgi:PAS domain S-box-containing protein
MLVNRVISCFQLLVIAIILVLITPQVKADDQTLPIRRILKFASELDYPPFALVRPDGSADGFLVDLLKAVTKSVGLEVNFVDGPWHEIKQKLMLHYLFYILVLILFLLIILGLWYLKREVTKKTLGLREKIKKQKQADEALSDPETRYRLLFEHSPEGIVIIDPETARPLHFNETAHRQLGYSREEFARLNISDFEAAETAEETRSRIVKVMREGRNTFETLHRTRQGEIRNILVTAQSTDILGRIFYHCVWRDITDQKQLEEALRESERKYRELFDLSPVGIFKTNSKGQALFVNPEMARILGADSPQDAVDNFQDLARDLYVDPNRRKEFIDLMGEKGAVENFEYEARGLDGKCLWLSMNAKAREKLSDGTFIIDGFTTDITERKHAEASLWESREELAEIFSMSLDLICIADINSATFLKVNPAFSRILGYSEQELLDRSFLKFIHPDDVAPTFAIINERLKKGETVIDFMNRYQCKDGTYRWLQWVSHPIPKRGVTFAVAHDITDRKRADEILLESEKKLQAVFNRSPVGLILFNSQSVVLDCNQHFANIFGVRREEYIGLNLLDRMSEGPIRQNLVNAISDDGVHHYEGPYTSILSAKQLYISLSSEKIAPNLLIAIIMDVTERKWTEDALRESEEKFRLTFNFSPDAVNINRLDDGLFVDINEGFTRATGYTREDVIGRTSSEINLWHDPADRQQLVQGLRENGFFENLEARFRRKDGSLISALMSARVISLKGVSHIISITRDITERKLISAKLQQAQKFEAIGTLAGGIAHDFNNLLMGIQGHASLLSLDLETSHPHREHIHAIEEHIRSATNLTKQLLGFARGGKYEVKSIDMNELLLGSSAMFSRTKK